MTPTEIAYRLLVRTARLASRVLPGSLTRGDGKLARGLRARRGAAGRLVAWGRAHRDGDGAALDPLVWFHAPSVGEGLQARAVIEALRRERPALRVAFTHFSPSAEALARSMPAEVTDYLPWDVSGEVGPVLAALRPDLVVFTKTEVWPVLIEEATRRGIPSCLVAATLPEGSSRSRWPARPVLRTTLGRLAAVHAIAGPDARRFVRMGAASDAVEVTGDPGIDSAQERARSADPDAPYLRPFRREPRPTLVAGSTWPPDEAVLVEALASVREDHPDLRLIVAPHEPAGHVEPLEAALGAGGWRTSRLSTVEAAGSVDEAGAVVVDRVGVLAHLYTVGSIAYVGGGFHDDGLHSVLEPAAAGVPVLFGPRHGNAHAARELVQVGGGRAVNDAADLAAALRAWLSDEGMRREAGAAAGAYVERHRGAAARTAERLTVLLEP